MSVKTGRYVVRRAGEIVSASGSWSLGPAISSGQVEGAEGTATWHRPEFIAVRDQSHTDESFIGDDITVDWVDADGTTRVFTGYVRSTNGATLSEAQSTLGDGTDAMTRSLELRPMAWTLPVHPMLSEPGAGGRVRHVGLFGTWFTHQAMTVAGYDPGVPMHWSSVWHENMCGSIATVPDPKHSYASLGDLRQAYRLSDPDQAPRFPQGDRQIVAADVLAFGVTSPARPGTADLGWQVTVDMGKREVDPTYGSNGEVLLRNLKTSNGVVLEWTETQVLVRYHSNGGARTTLGTYSRTYNGIRDERWSFAWIPGGGVTVRAARFEADGTWSWRVVGNISTSGTALPTGANSLCTVRVSSPGVIGTVNVTRGNRNYMVEDMPQGNIFRHDMTTTSLPGWPYMPLTEAGQILSNQASAQIGMRGQPIWQWINEHGVLVNADFESLATRAVAHVFDTKPGSNTLALDELQWQTTPNELYSAVEVDYTNTRVLLRNTASLLLAQGDQETLENGDEYEQVLQPDSNRFWLEPDLRPLQAGWPYPPANFPDYYRNALNRAVKSHVGGHRMNKENGTLRGWLHPYQMGWTINSSGHIVDAMEMRDPDTVVVKGTAVLPLGPPEQVASTMPHPNSTGLWAHRKEQPLPQLRGFGLGLIQQLSLRNEIDGVDLRHGSLRHDCGLWIQNTSGAKRVMSCIYDAVLNPTPVRTAVVEVSGWVKVGQKVTLRERRLDGVLIEEDIIVATLAGETSSTSDQMTIEGIVTARRYDDEDEWITPPPDIIPELPPVTIPPIEEEIDPDPEVPDLPPAEPPLRPSTPTLIYDNAQGFKVVWDGKDYLGNNAINDEYGVTEIALERNNMSTTEVVGSMFYDVSKSEWSYYHTGPVEYGEPYYARLRIINRFDGTASLWSSASDAVVPFPLVDEEQFEELEGRLDEAADWIAGTGTELDNKLNIAFPDGPFDIPEALGNTVTEYVVEYAVNDSETVPPAAGWSTDTPTRTPGSYIWYRTLITYGDDTTSTSNPALLTGNDGEPGGDGTPAKQIDLTATTQILRSPATGGATTPATAVVTGTATNTTITVWQYSVNGGGFSNTVPAGVSRTGNVVTITGATMTAATIAVRMADAGGVADTLTVAKVADGQQGGPGDPGDPGEDAITILLSNEAHTFPGGTSAALAGSTTTTLSAYKGATALNIAVGTITGQVTGLTTAVAGSGTAAPTITVTVTTALVATSGKLQIPVTVDGKSFTKEMSWSVNRTGATGAAGPSVSLAATTQVLAHASGSGSTTPATSVVTASASGTTVSTWQYSVDGGAFSTTRPAYVSAPASNSVTVTGSTMTARTVAIRAIGAITTATDTVTIAKVSDGAGGGAGADAYTVLLTNESHTFVGDEDSALAGSAITGVLAFKGATQIAATIGTITGQVTGLTTSIQNNGTTTAQVTVTVTTSLATTSGVLTIPLTIDGKSFTKRFSWSVALKGSGGAPGTPGVGITSVTPFFLLQARGETNLVPDAYTSFEGDPAWYLANMPRTGSFIAEIKTGGAKTGQQYLELRKSNTSNTELTLSTPDGNTSNVVVTPGKTYEYSVWVRGGAITSNLGLRARYSDGTFSTTTTQSVPVGSGWTKYSAQFTVPAGVTGLNLRLICSTLTVNAGWDVDSIELNEAIAPPALPTTDPPPSPWTETEPEWETNSKLFRTERVRYTNSTFAYTPVSQVSAYAGVDAAMRSANGKNLITYSDIADANKPGPAPSVGLGIGRTINDVHRNRNTTTGEIYAEYLWNGSAWSEVNFGDSILRSLDVGKLTAGAAAIQTAVIDKLWADVIAARKITTEMLMIGGMSNYLDNPFPKLITSGPIGWEGITPGSPLPTGVALVAGTNPSTPGDAVLRITGSANGSNKYTMNTGSVPMQPGDVAVLRYQVTGVSDMTAGNLAFAYAWQSAAGAWNSIIISNQFAPPANGVTKEITVELTAPAGVVALRMGPWAAGSQNGVMDLFDFSLMKKSSGYLIVDGTIEGKHVNATSIAAEIGEFLSITSANIEAGAVNAGHLDAASIWANSSWLGQAKASVLQVGSISPEMVTGIDELSVNPTWSRTELLDTVPYDRKGSGLSFSTVSTYQYKGSTRVLMLSTTASGSSTIQVTDTNLVSPGDEIYMRMMVRKVLNTDPGTSGTGVAMRITWLNTAGATISTDLFSTLHRMTTAAERVVYSMYDGTFMAPDGAAKFYVEITGGSAAHAYLVTGTSVKRVMGAVDPTGMETVIQPSGVSVYERTEVESGSFERTLLTSMGRQYTAYDPESGAISSMMGSEISSPVIAAEDSLLVSGENVLEYLQRLPQGIIVNDRPTTVGPYSSSEVGYREVSFPATGGRAYLISFWFDYNASGTSTQYVHLRKTHATPPAEAAAPTVSSAEFMRLSWYGNTATSQAATILFKPTNDENTRWLWTYRAGGSATSRIREMSIQVYDMGPFTDLPVSGVYSSGGATPSTGEPAPPAPDPTPPPQTRTQTFDFAWSGTYNNYGSDPTGWVPTSKIRQGLGGSSRYQGLFGLSTSDRAKLTGSTIKKIEVYLYHDGPAASGAAKIGTHRYAAKPAYSTQGGTVYNAYHTVSSWGKKSGKWVTLPSSFHAQFQSASSMSYGITVGNTAASWNLMDFISSTSSGSTRPRLRVTYTK